MSWYKWYSQLKDSLKQVQKVCTSGIWTQDHVRSWVQLVHTANFVELFQIYSLFNVMFHFAHCLLQSPRFLSSIFSWGNQMSPAEWVDTCGVRHWSILWSSYRKEAWVGFFTHGQWIPFRRCKRLRYQAISSSRIQSQLCRATPMGSFVQSHISFWPIPSAVATFLFIKTFFS